MNRLVTVARAAGFCSGLAIILLSLVPGPDRPHTGLPGEAEHFAAYCLTGLAFAPAVRPLAFRIALVVGLTLLAGAMEVLQHFVPGRHPAAADAIASSLGALTGIALGGLLFGLAALAYHKHRRFSETPGPVR
ncbi:VanZ family protein [Methylocapsa sp. D3K7]|uniref:VanZ family protein n=1 Tax=Methylocapsa sp. D3K7 TaxID=3041435 RepID=UPI00244EAD05|nr:VanZ family protein [Methylocapsa sp. D3K7]WGJ13422.1 VanZ family protein [Methylocapsa sp. D3K7]